MLHPGPCGACRLPLDRGHHTGVAYRWVRGGRLHAGVDRQHLVVGDRRASRTRAAAVWELGKRGTL